MGGPWEIEKTRCRCRMARSSRVPVSLQGELEKDLKGCFTLGEEAKENILELSWFLNM